jgi:hypothetical protein
MQRQKPEDEGDANDAGIGTTDQVASNAMKRKEI